MKVKKEKEYLAEEMYEAVSIEYEVHMKNLVDRINYVLSDANNPETSNTRYEQLALISDEMHRLSRLVRALYIGDFKEQDLKTMLELCKQNQLLDKLDKVLAHRDERQEDAKTKELWQHISDWIQLI
jgi:hypothetical protein